MGEITASKLRPMQVKGGGESLLRNRQILDSLLRISIERGFTGDEKNAILT